MIAIDQLKETFINGGIVGWTYGQVNVRRFNDFIFWGILSTIQTGDENPYRTTHFDSYWMILE